MAEYIEFIENIDWASVSEAVMTIESLGYGSLVLAIAGLVIGYRRWHRGH